MVWEGGRVGLYIFMGGREISKVIEERMEKMEVEEEMGFREEEKMYFEENFEGFDLKKGDYVIRKDELVEDL